MVVICRAPGGAKRKLKSFFFLFLAYKGFSVKHTKQARTQIKLCNMKKNNIHSVTASYKNIANRSCHIPSFTCIVSWCSTSSCFVESDGWWKNSAFPTDLRGMGVNWSYSASSEKVIAAQWLVSPRYVCHGDLKFAQRVFRSIKRVNSKEMKEGRA